MCLTSQPRNFDFKNYKNIELIHTKHGTLHNNFAGQFYNSVMHQDCHLTQKEHPKVHLWPELSNICPIFKFCLNLQENELFQFALIF